MRIRFIRKYLNKKLHILLDTANKFDHKKHEELKKRSAQKVPDFFDEDDSYF